MESLLESCGVGLAGKIENSKILKNVGNSKYANPKISKSAPTHIPTMALVCIFCVKIAPKLPKIAPKSIYIHTRPQTYKKCKNALCARVWEL